MSENENNFETLRRILALKRREIPPPGYFDDFSSRVIMRIRVSEDGSQNLIQRLPWLLQLLQAFETKPVYSGAFALSLCLLLLFGIVYVEQRPEVEQQPILQSAQNTMSYAVGSATPLAPVAGQPLIAMGNTNPIVGLPANASLFDSQPSPFFQQASFLPNGN